MAGFEVVVRPVVFPDIRPAPARSLPPQDDPEKGFAVIKGNGAKSLTTSESFSMSMSKSRSVETERRVDEVRVYQMGDDGAVNQDTFIDIDVANRISMQKGLMPVLNATMEEVTKQAVARDRERENLFYQRLKEADNIEIKNRDVIKRAE
jgi:hypothetical protein